MNINTETFRIISSLIYSLVMVLFIFSTIKSITVVKLYRKVANMQHDLICKQQKVITDLLIEKHGLVEPHDSASDNGSAPDEKPNEKQ